MAANSTTPLRHRHEHKRSHVCSRAKLVQKADAMDFVGGLLRARRERPRRRRAAEKRDELARFMLIFFRLEVIAPLESARSNIDGT